MLQTADEIRANMKRLRADLHEDVDEAYESARGLTDWKAYVRRYPWICLGAAAAIGYLIVPETTRTVSPSREDLLDLAKDNKLVIQANPSAEAQSPSVVGSLVRLLGNAAMRGAVSFLGQQIGKYTGNQAADAVDEE